MFKKISQIFSLVMTSIFILFGAFCIWFYIFLQTPLSIPPAGQVVIIPKGSSLKLITDILARENVLKRSFGFKLWVQLNNAKGKIKAGEYLIKPGMTPKTLLELFISGKVIQYALTVVEGWTFNDLMQAIAESEKLEHTLGMATAAEVMEKLGAKGQHPEGQFFPETYCFPLGTTDLAFLKRAHELMNKKLEIAWNERNQALPFKTPYEALILASIIEKESSVFEEYAEIAGVYVRRLLLNMPLQADPTVIYGIEDVAELKKMGTVKNINKNTPTLPDTKGSDSQNNTQATQAKNTKREITLSMLRTPNPYNTYLNRGLPPTPIALPSLKALQAATQPAEGDTLYFVAKGKGERGHVFSKTLTEHNVKVNDYRNSKPKLQANTLTVEKQNNNNNSDSSNVSTSSTLPEPPKPGLENKKTEPGKPTQTQEKIEKKSLKKKNALKKDAHQKESNEKNKLRKESGQKKESNKKESGKNESGKKERSKKRIGKGEADKPTISKPASSKKEPETKTSTASSKKQKKSK